MVGISFRRIVVMLGLLAVAFGVLSCGRSGQDASAKEGSAGGSAASGSVDVDGSSTVMLISAAVAEEFMKESPDVQVVVNESGTGGGMKKFTAGEIDICDASRPIQEGEIAAAKEKNIEWIELPIAYDGLSVLVNPKNTFVDDISVAELKKIWEPDSKVKTWADIRPGWPNKEIKLYGPGTDSGTFEYFTETIVGKKKASRSDYQASEDDNVLVQGVAGDEFALGYFGYGYYVENKDKLKLLKVDGVLPTPETVRTGSYKPLSRPLFIYVNKKSLDTKPAVGQFLAYYLDHVKELSAEVGYVPLPDEIYTKVKAHLESKETGPSKVLTPK